jgi:hypothetical protein
MKLPAHTDRFRAFWKICLWGVCVCVFACTRERRKFVTACFVTPPPHHHSFSWRNKLHLSMTTVFSRSCTVQSFAFHECQHRVYRPLFCIHWRNATEHNIRSHFHNKRGLQEELSAMAGLLEHLCTQSRAVTVIVIRVGLYTCPLSYKLCFNSRTLLILLHVTLIFYCVLCCRIFFFLCFILMFVPCIFIICIMNQQMHNWSTIYCTALYCTAPTCFNAIASSSGSL